MWCRALKANFGEGESEQAGFNGEVVMASMINQTMLSLLHNSFINKMLIKSVISLNNDMY